MPLLRQAVRWVGHVQIRNRGAVDGSVAHADPAGELPVALAAPDARFHVCSAAAPTPVRAHAAEESLRGRRLDGDAVVEAAAAAIEGISLTGDIHGSADYRRELTRAMVRRALLAIAEGGEAR